MKIKSIYFKTFVFLIFNFGALAIGGFLMNNGPSSLWYENLNRAPWTPPGWVFGAAWTSIMICFSFYMAKLSNEFKFLNKKLFMLYAVQWVLNAGWNLAFFNMHSTISGLLIIIALWLIVGYFTFKYLKLLQLYTLFIVPYLIWLTIATSLNAYVVLYN